MAAIGVIGYGVVGKAVANGFEAKRKMKVLGYDPNIEGMKVFKDVCNASVVFVCVPTPTVDGEQDLTALRDTFRKLAENHYHGIIVIKSTILPGTTEMLSKEFGLKRVVHNPEFLTAANAEEDFMNQKSVLLGSLDQEALFDAADVYQSAGFDNIMIANDPKVTELAKYAHNCFLSIKVTFFNELYDVCKGQGVEYQNMMRFALSSGGIGDGHTKVPGPDGKRGYAGHCFPKDTDAFRQFCVAKSTPMATLDAAIKVNEKLRPDAYEGNFGCVRRKD